MNKESIIAIVRIVVPAVCGVAGVLGYTIDAENLTNIALVLVGAGLSVYTGWKNNNVTDAAQTAQKMLEELKAKDA